LGVVAYELATLELPFTAKTAPLLPEVILSGKYKKMRKGVEVELKRLISKMLIVV
jgi:hypothetical protein